MAIAISDLHVLESHPRADYVRDLWVVIPCERYLQHSATICGEIDSQPRVFSVISKTLRDSPLAFLMRINCSRISV